MTQSLNHPRAQSLNRLMARWLNDPMNQSKVVLYSKPDCCLCDEVKAQLRRLQKTHRFEWREVNILEDQDAFMRFKEEIPVVFINGKKAFKFHLDEEAFLKRLRNH